MRKRTLPRGAVRRRREIPEPSPYLQNKRTLDINTNKESVMEAARGNVLPYLMQDLEKNPSKVGSILPVIEEQFGLRAVPWLRALYARTQSPLREKILESFRRIESNDISL